MGKGGYSGNRSQGGYNYNGNGGKQPMSNNFVNRSLQGGLPTQADSMSYGAAGGAYTINAQSNIDRHNEIGGETI